MLTAAREQYRTQQRVATMGLREAQRRSGRGSRTVARTVAAYQVAAIDLTLEKAPDVLTEQGISPRSVGNVAPTSLLTEQAATAAMLDKASTDAAFDRLVLALIHDAGRTAQSVDNATRPAITGYVRSLNPPSCSRCAILAGRVYRYSQGFQRHPRCDCLMTPTTEALGKDLVTDPMAAFERGEIRGLSKADEQAIRDGADIGQVVNVRRKAAGLTEGSSVMVRAGRMTPNFIYRVANDRAEQLTLLRKYGYVL